MLVFPEFAESPMWYAGLIWAMAMGWAASSYASNFAWRLPRGETPFGREPYCGDCNTALTPRDLMPIFSWLLSGGKCRHCGAKVPASYFLLEALYTPYVGLCYVAYSFGDLFILLAFLGMLLQIAAMMAWDDDYTSFSVTTLVLAGGLMFQLTQGHLLLDGLLAVFFGLFGALILHALFERKAPTKDIYSLPKWIWVVAACAAWLNITTGYLFTALWLAIPIIGRVFTKEKNWLAVAPAPALLIAVWSGLLA